MFTGALRHFTRSDFPKDGTKGRTVVKHVQKDFREGQMLRWSQQNCTTLFAALQPRVFTPLQQVTRFFKGQTGSVSPVPGLLICNGFSCPLCNYHSGSSRRMDNHRRKHHAHVNTALNPNIVQCLVRGVGRHYFAVRCSSDPQGNVDTDPTLLKSALSKSIAEVKQKLQPDHNPPAKELSPWLRVSRWSKFVSELIPEEASYDAVKGAMLLSSSAMDKSPYSRLLDVMRLYANKVREVGSEVSYHVACMVMAFESTRGFTQFLHANTVHKYSLVMSAFVLALLRSACDPTPSDAVRVVIAPDYLRDDLMALRRQLVQLGRDPIQEDGFDCAVLHRVLLGLWTPPRPIKVSARVSIDSVFL
ncbi:unnamed protein product [Calypogeia fissa]